MIDDEIQIFDFIILREWRRNEYPSLVPKYIIGNIDPCRLLGILALSPHLPIVITSWQEKNFTHKQDDEQADNNKQQLPLESSENETESK